MPTTPATTDFDITAGDTSSAVREVIDAKYTDAGAWATYAATILESKLSSIVDANDDFDISAFLTAAENAVNNIPAVTPGTIIYTAPTAPTYDVVPTYSAPTAPTFDIVGYTPPTEPVLATATYDAPVAGQITAINYNAPTAPTHAAADYTAPVAGVMVDAPTPTVWTAGAAPATAISFSNPDFTDPLIDTLRNRIGVTGTGLIDAEAGLFARETARQNEARSLAYDEITTQFSNNGWDMPPGALLAKQTEVNNKSTIILSDSSSQIMAESARLAQLWNTATLSAGTQLMDLLGRLFDSKIMRDFEAAKNSVVLSLEGFKAAIAEVVANAQLEGQYISSISAYNESVVNKYSAEIGGETARVTGIIEGNKAKVDQYAAEIGGETTRINAIAETNKSVIAQFAAEVDGSTAKLNGVVASNKGLIDQFTAEVQAAATLTSSTAQSNDSKARAFTAEVNGAIAPITAVAESNRSVASAYSAAVGGATADVQAQGERERAAATAGDINSRKALGIADIATKFALANIETATRKYLGDITMMQGVAQSAAQMISGALNGVTAGVSLGYSADTTISNDRDKNVNVLYQMPAGSTPPSEY